MRRGIIFTIDALLALLFSASFVTLLYQNSLPVEDIYRDFSLYAYSSDFLTVLDKGGYLNELADKDIRNTMKLMPYTPDPYCFYVRVEDSEGKKVATVHKPTCSGSRKNIDVYVRRLFVYNGETYLAELGSWYKTNEEAGD
ncbi:MAG: hypothetical protein N3H30_02705 [Candidatus Micrarchaeota archaeon]|nr:hypothetical protein [Candidatus Micrarchaeota archaeon]